MLTKNSVDLVVINDELEALAVRGCLERWGIATNLHLIGKASDLVQLFSEPTKLSPNILITCHGTTKGICLPELAPQVAKKEPYSDFLTPSDLKQFVRLNGQTVVSTGCVTGKQPFAKVYLSGGAGTYIAPKGYPEGDMSLLFVVNFYYFLLVKKISTERAYDSAIQVDQAIGEFSLFAT